MSRFSILVVAALLGATPAAAQQHDGQHTAMDRQRMHGMPHCMDVMGGPPPAMLLHHEQALDLSAEQVRRLEQLQTRMRDVAMPRARAAMQTRTAAAELLEGEAPDLAAYEARLREVADHMIEAHTAMARAAVEARQVLTADQRERLDDLAGDRMDGDHGRMDGDDGVMGGDHDMMGGDHDMMGGDHDRMGGDHEMMPGEHDMMGGDHGVTGGDHDMNAHHGAGMAGMMGCMMMGTRDGKAAGHGHGQ